MGAPDSYAFAALYDRAIGCHLALARLSIRVLCGCAPGLYEPFDRRLYDQKRRTPVLSLSRSLRFPQQCEIQGQDGIPRGRRCGVRRGCYAAPDIHAHIEYGRYLAIV